MPVHSPRWRGSRSWRKTRLFTRTFRLPTSCTRLATSTATFDQRYAERRLGELGIPLRAKAGKLSGGQQAQLALTLALARRPQLLVLDEPMAALDPIAREGFMATVMRAVTEDGVSVVLSSHVLAELERVADYLVLVSSGSIQLAGEVEDLLATHRMLSGPIAGSEQFERERRVLHAAGDGSKAELLVRLEDASEPVPPGWEAGAVTLEDLTLAYLREPNHSTLSGSASGWVSTSAATR